MAYLPYSGTMQALSGLGESLGRLSALDAAGKEREMRHGLAMSELGLRKEQIESGNKLGLLQAANQRERQIAEEKRYADELARETARDADIKKRYEDELAEEKRQNTLLPAGKHLYNSYIAQGMTPDDANKAITELVGQDTWMYDFLKKPTTLKTLPSVLQWMTQAAREDRRTAATVAKAEAWGKVNDDAKYMSGLDMSKPENQKFVRMKQAEYREKGFYLAPVTKVETQIRTEYDATGNQKTVQVPVSTTAFMPVPMANAMPEEKKADFEEYQKGLMEQHPWAKTNNVALKAMATEAYANPAKEREIVDRWGSTTMAINPQGKQVKWKDTGAGVVAAAGPAGKTRRKAAIQKVDGPGLRKQYGFDPTGGGAMYERGVGPVPAASGSEMTGLTGVPGFIADVAMSPLTYIGAGIPSAFKNIAGRAAPKIIEGVAPALPKRAYTPFVTESAPYTARNINPAMSRLRNIQRTVDTPPPSSYFGKQPLELEAYPMRALPPTSDFAWSGTSPLTSGRIPSVQFPRLLGEPSPTNLLTGKTVAEKAAEAKRLRDIAWYEFQRMNAIGRYYAR